MYIPKTGSVSEKTVRGAIAKTYNLDSETMSMILVRIAFRLARMISMGVYKSIQIEYPEISIPSGSTDFNRQVLNEIVRANNNQTLMNDTVASFHEKAYKAILQCASIGEENLNDE